MAYVFKGIDKSKIINESTKVHKSFSLSSSLDAISSVKFRSASYSDTSLNKLSDVGNHWHFLMLNFYLSGSDKASADKKYNYSYYTNVLKNTQIPQHLNKFYSSGSVIYIPQKYFGEDIKPGSFKIVDSSDSNGNIEIKDDGFGNLYPVNNRHSQSADTSISSSDNYVGNIFYNLGVVAFTETGSYSGSVNYTSIGDNFTINFDSTQTIYTTEYSIRVNPKEFGTSNNPTCRTGSMLGTLKSDLQKNGWTPYVNKISLHTNSGRDISEPIIETGLSQPVKLRNDMSIIFKIKHDF
jgi:hypothetical protein